MYSFLSIYTSEALKATSLRKGKKQFSPRKTTGKFRIKRSTHTKDFRSSAKPTNFESCSSICVRNLLITPGSRRLKSPHRSRTAAFQWRNRFFPPCRLSLSYLFFHLESLSTICTHECTRVLVPGLFSLVAFWTSLYAVLSCSRTVVSTVGGCYVEVMSNIYHVLSPARILSTEN